MVHTRLVGYSQRTDLDRSGGEVDYLGEIASRWRFVMRRTVRLRRSSPTHKPRPSVRRGAAVADPDQARRADRPTGVGVYEHHVVELGERGVVVVMGFV
jgi:hypothetical protein